MVVVHFSPSAHLLLTLTENIEPKFIKLLRFPDVAARPAPLNRLLVQPAAGPAVVGVEVDVSGGEGLFGVVEGSGGGRFSAEPVK